MVLTRALALCLMGGLSLHAVTGITKEASTEMMFKGTLIEPPPCTINDGGRVDVDFGTRVGVSKVDGVNYRKQVNYQVTCGSAGSRDWTLKLSLKGTASAFDSSALGTDRDNLGIRIYQNDTPFKPGDTLKIARNAPPRLEAVPVKKSGATLTEGAFEAWATLQADYQ